MVRPRLSLNIFPWTRGGCEGRSREHLKKKRLARVRDRATAQDDDMTWRGVAGIYQIMVFMTRRGEIGNSRVIVFKYDAARRGRNFSDNGLYDAARRNRLYCIEKNAQTHLLFCGNRI